MSIKRVLAAIVLLAACTTSGCGSTGDKAEFPSAQQIVDTVAAKHPEVVRLTLHAVPSGESQARVIASNVASKLRKPSDPEDLRALATGEEVVMQEGSDLDVTIPLANPSGRPSSVAGVTLRGTPGRTRDQLIADARAVAAELNQAIRAATQPLW